MARAPGCRPMLNARRISECSLAEFFAEPGGPAVRIRPWGFPLSISSQKVLTSSYTYIEIFEIIVFIFLGKDL